MSVCSWAKFHVLGKYLYIVVYRTPRRRADEHAVYHRPESCGERRHGDFLGRCDKILDRPTSQTVGELVSPSLFYCTVDLLEANKPT